MFNSYILCKRDILGQQMLESQFVDSKKLTLFGC